MFDVCKVQLCKITMQDKLGMKLRLSFILGFDTDVKLENVWTDQCRDRTGEDFLEPTGKFQNICWMSGWSTCF